MKNILCVRYAPPPTPTHHPGFPQAKNQVGPAQAPSTLASGWAGGWVGVGWWWQEARMVRPIGAIQKQCSYKLVYTIYVIYGLCKIIGIFV